MFRIKLSLALVFLLTSGCVHHPPDPLEPRAELDGARQQRRAIPPPASQRLDLRALAARLRVAHPVVVERLAHAEAAERVAAIGKVLPNPSVDVGAAILNGLGVVGAQRYSIGGAVSWALPLAGKLEAQADLERARARAAAVAAICAEREAYLDLRSSALRAALAQRHLDLRREVEAGRRRMVRQVEDLVRAGSATSVDVALVRVEWKRVQGAVLAAEAEVTACRQHLAEVVGLPLHALPEAPALPVRLPDAAPAREALELALVTQHPALAAAVADYAVLERALVLQLRQQYPDLVLSGGYLSETAIDFYQFPGVSLELPILDRNQRGIARALGERSRAKASYKVALQARLAALDGVLARLPALEKARRAADEEARSEVEAALRLAERALRVGSTDLLHVLEVARLRDEVRLEAWRAREAELEAWLALEAAVGVPLLELDGQPTLGDREGEASP